MLHQAKVAQFRLTPFQAPLLSCPHRHAIAVWNPLKHFSTFMFYRAGHLQSIWPLLPQAVRVLQSGHRGSGDDKRSRRHPQDYAREDQAVAESRPVVLRQAGQGSPVGS
jgi:hypothetical protein